MLWSKYFFGLSLFGYSFIHTDLIYAFAFFGLSLFFSGKKVTAIASFAILSNFYPPLSYFFVAPFFLFILREERVAATIKYFSLYLILFSPMIFSYFQRGVFNLVLEQSELDWTDYFLINLETIFRLLPITTTKLNYISSFVGAILIYISVAHRQESLSKPQQLFIRCWQCYLAYAIVCILLTWLECSLALKLQLLRTTMVAVAFSLIGITFLVTPHWSNARFVEKALLLISMLSSHLFVVLFGALYFIQAKRSKIFALGGAVVLLIAIAFTTQLSFPPMLGYNKMTPWFDVAQQAKKVLPVSSLTLIPPVADMTFCETDDYLTFRLLAQRSTTLKLSDGVEVSYNGTFAKQYVDYLTELSHFLAIKPNFSNACAFRQSFYNGWMAKPTSEILSFAQKIGADYLLIDNNHLGIESLSGFVFKGTEFSVIKVETKH